MGEGVDSLPVSEGVESVLVSGGVESVSVSGGVESLLVSGGVESVSLNNSQSVSCKLQCEGLVTSCATFYPFNFFFFMSCFRIALLSYGIFLPQTQIGI